MAESSITCAGAAHFDTIAQATHPLDRGADVPGRVERRPGGVAFNIAMQLAVTHRDVRLVSAVGDDRDGDALLDAAKTAGIDVSGVVRPPRRSTDQYLAIEDETGELFAACADSTLLEHEGTAVLDRLCADGAGRTLILDGNLGLDVLQELASGLLPRSTELCLVPGSPTKARRLSRLMSACGAMIYANLGEANAMLGAAHTRSADAARDLLAAGARGAVVTDGAADAAHADARDVITATPPAVTRGRVTGAGDALIAAHITAERMGRHKSDALADALRGAAEHMKGNRQ